MTQIFKHGQMPTPPYIKRIVPAKEYQTIYAQKIGSVAAPTAGLHFTKRIFQKLKKLGVQIEFVTLHVGLGTFAPVKKDDITTHQIHSEYFELDKATANRLNQAKQEGRRIIAIGTTSVRVLESCSKFHNSEFIIHNSKGDTQIFIYPGYKFKFTDAMITNFHLPKSTLIMLIAAFANLPLIKKAYAHAIRKKYRFYSLGDAMLIN
jgi:S-adenosylmethionine:tRNA ribosyltransferase-isomerase